MNIKCMEIIIYLLPWETHSWSVGKYISWHYQSKKVKVYVCLYSHSWVYARTCKSVFLCHLHLCSCVCVVVRVCVCFCVSTRACVCVCTKEICMYVCINWRFFYVCAYVCSCVRVYGHAWVCAIQREVKRQVKSAREHVFEGNMTLSYEMCYVSLFIEKNILLRFWNARMMNL